MAVTDPIADLLTRIRNGHHALHGDISAPKSKMKVEIARILKEEGYIADFNESERDLSITLKYAAGKPIIAGLQRISKPGRRVYVGADEIPRVQNGLGICILSTSHGVMDGNTAASRNIGGELLCQIW